MDQAQAELLRRLTLGDEGALRRLMCEEPVGLPLLDDKTSAFARLGALVAIEADAASFQCAVDAAFAAGADDAEITDVVLVVAAVVGLCRVSAAAWTLTTDLVEKLDPQHGDYAS